MASVFSRRAKVVDTPWQLAVGEDFRYAETEGKKSRWTDWLNAYVLRVHIATHHDQEVYAQFLRVMYLPRPARQLTISSHPVARVETTKSREQRHGNGGGDLSLVFSYFLYTHEGRSIGG